METKTLNTMPKSLLIKNLVACQTLLNKYKYPTHTSKIRSCPLCNVNACSTCPWNTIELPLRPDLWPEDDHLNVCCGTFFDSVSTGAFGLQLSEARNVKPHHRRDRHGKSHCKPYVDAVQRWRIMRLEQLPRWIAELEAAIYC